MPCYCGHMLDEHDPLGPCDVTGCDCFYYDEDGDVE